MGFAEMCIRMGISYASESAVAFASELMSFIAREARAESARLAERRGVFPNWEKSRYRSANLRVRNATQTSIAPTGTISIIAGTSSSIEPLFALAYRRVNVLGEQTLAEFNPLFLRCIESEAAGSRMLRSIERSGRLMEGDGLHEHLRKLFVTALEVEPEQHVRVQAAFQRHVDNAVSKTVNLPADATPKDVADVYRLAHRIGCKGVTVFRYGSKSDQVLELGIEESPYEREHFTRCDPGACRL
jgi:ribonucleoside-diphosphate reductase alpha chain